MTTRPPPTTTSRRPTYNATATSHPSGRNTSSKSTKPENTHLPPPPPAAPLRAFLHYLAIMPKRSHRKPRILRPKRRNGEKSKVETVTTSATGTDKHIINNYCPITKALLSEQYMHYTHLPLHVNSILFLFFATMASHRGFEASLLPSTQKASAFRRVFFSVELA